jgi:hypothetical protein
VAVAAPALENPAVAPPTPTPAPAAEPAKPAAEPVKAAAEPAKPAAVEQAGAPKPPAEEPKPVVAAAEKAEKIEPAKSADKAEKAERAGKKESQSESSKSSKSKAARWDDKPVAADEDIYRLVVRSAPLSAEVLIDGEYFSRTPCERRILDPKKSYTVVVRKEGYESQERLVGPTDNWAKKGEERVLTVTASLKRIKAGASGGPTEETPSGEPKKAETPAAKAEVAPSGDSAKVPVKEPAKAEPAAKPETAKAAVPAADKPVFKPAPDFDDQGKGKAKE